MTKLSPAVLNVLRALERLLAGDGRLVLSEGDRMFWHDRLARCLAEVEYGDLGEPKGKAS